MNNPIRDYRKVGAYILAVTAVAAFIAYLTAAPSLVLAGIAICGLSVGIFFLYVGMRR
jgi:hypothetical protein